MTKDEDFKLLKIQNCVLRVNIHCDGCKQKVKKLLQRIEGVFQVIIDAEQKVTVSGNVDSATLIKKLVRAGKHAELWSQKTNQHQKQKANCINDDKSNKGQKQGLIKGLEALKNQQKFPFNLEEDEDLDDEEEDDDEDDELRYLNEKANQLNLLRQQAAAMQGNSGQKGFGTAMAAATASKNGKMNHQAGNGSVAKKGNHPPNQNMVMKANPAGIDQKTMQALKMNNVQFGGGANVNPGEGKMVNDINSMMNLAGFHGNAANNYASVLGGNSGNAPGGGVYHQLQPNAGMATGHHPSAGFPNAGMATGHHPSAMMMNMNGGYQQQQQQYNHPFQSMMMNLQNRHAMQQPQMMYNRSPFIPTSTGYCYSYGPPVPPGAYMSTGPCYNSPHGGDHSATTDMFSDENASSCSIM